MLLLLLRGSVTGFIVSFCVLSSYYWFMDHFRTNYAFIDASSLPLSMSPDWEREREELFGQNRWRVQGEWVDYWVTSQMPSPRLTAREVVQPGQRSLSLSLSLSEETEKTQSSWPHFFSHIDWRFKPDIIASCKSTFLRPKKHWPQNTQLGRTKRRRQRKKNGAFIKPFE